ncbi:platelet-activating factor acetylhydrolase-like isoform X1 [Daphnia pulex]|uniref:platelet-activating factor acetylhydrolase-like isoform X1 n=1 Tax=Daphnia pulex TaxID=6669 RepID=UPI001EE000A8|nr:platelet-activating factor acetylhydrolase-like isoform X1 [Daphnia pulex]
MELPHSYRGKRHVPVPSGRFVVGCTDLMIGGPTKEDGCFLRIFYPTKLTDTYANSNDWATWLPHRKYKEGYAIVRGLTSFIGKRVISWVFGKPYIPVVVDGEPSNEPPFPVIVFSHGIKSCRTVYSIFCSDISSHGFIVAAIEHRDGSACMSYTLEREQSIRGGLVERWIPYRPLPFERNDMPSRREQLEIRTRECTQTLDLLARLNDGVQVQHLLHSTMDLAIFKGLMDLSSPIIAGHSFGSTTLLRTLAVDKRYKIGLAMDAWMWPLKDEPELAESIEQPILFINSANFQTRFSLEIMKRFTADADKRHVVTIKGSIHDSQSDVPCLLPKFIRRFEYPSAIDPLLATQLSNRITLLYLRRQLAGYPADDELSNLVEKSADLLLEGIP